MGKIRVRKHGEIFKFYPGVINNSTTNFRSDEKQFHEEGIKHSLEPLQGTKTLGSLIADLEVKVSLNDNLVNECANLIQNMQIETIDPGNTESCVAEKPNARLVSLSNGPIELRNASLVEGPDNGRGRSVEDAKY